MAQLFTPGLQISPAATVLKRRELSRTGRVLVSVGEIVRSNTIVAEADREGELGIVRVADELGIEPATVERFMRVAVGTVVHEGECLAELKSLWGLFKSTVSSPLAGTVEFISSATGHLGVRAPPKTMQLRAYIDGVVSHVDPGRGVVIKTTGTFVQGIFGVGGEQVGIVRLLAIAPEQRVTEQDIPLDVSGSILIGGHSPTAAALRRASECGAVGFITGSIDDATLCEYVGYDIGVALTGDEPVSMTVIITEGFGNIPMNSKVIEVLRGISGTRASINGATQVRAGALRPEIIAASSPGVSVAPPSESTGLVEGSAVRLIRVPYFGMHGVVTALPHELVQIETGAYARVARVRLSSDRREVVVPRANLEIA